MHYNRIVLNEPHASVEGLYDDRLSGWSIDERFINEVVFRLTDWHTDYLFHGTRHPKIRTVRFPLSRFIVDAERLWDDPMDDIGQGIIYRHFDGYRRQVSKPHEALLLRLWERLQQKLKRQLCEGALVKLVEHQHCNAFERGVGHQHAGEYALGEHLDARLCRCALLESYAIANSLSHRLIEHLRHAFGYLPCGHTAWLQHQYFLPFGQRSQHG